MESDGELGMVHVYTGDGKGKTTASLGLGLRASGHGYRVIMIQFMKGQINYGELEGVKPLDNFEIVQFGRPDFVDKDDPAEIDIKLAKDGIDHAWEVVKSGKYDMVILDEINVAVEWNLIPVDEVVRMIKKKPENLELVLTGRYCPQEFIDLADTVTEMKEIKHPYQKEVLARKGIEF